jgi:hypothetical protein
MLLSSELFGGIGSILRMKDGGLRRIPVRMNLKLAKTGGQLVDATLHHFSRGGFVVATPQRLELGETFGFYVEDRFATHLFFCEVVYIRPAAEGYQIGASFLVQQSNVRPRSRWESKQGESKQGESRQGQK